MSRLVFLAKYLQKYKYLLFPDEERRAEKGSAGETDPTCGG